jgi:hypothetical protein
MHEMKLRTSSDIIHSLRFTSSNLEQLFATNPEDEQELAELKRALLLGIADLESREAAKPADSEPAAPVL